MKRVAHLRLQDIMRRLWMVLREHPLLIDIIGVTVLAAFSRFGNSIDCVSMLLMMLFPFLAHFRGSIHPVRKFKDLLGVIVMISLLEGRCRWQLLL